MYSMNEYKAALAEREEKDFGSQSWNYAQAKVQAIAAILAATGNEEMVQPCGDQLRPGWHAVDRGKERIY